MLRKYEADPLHVVNYTDLTVVDEDVSCEVQPDQILMKDEKVLRGKSIPLVRVLWSRHGVEEETWEREHEMKSNYPQLFN